MLRSLVGSEMCIRDRLLLTRSPETVHTSTKARFTSITILIHMQIPNLDRLQNIIICSFDHCRPSLKISCESFRKFLRKVANKQTDKQTNNDDYISSLPEVIIALNVIHCIWLSYSKSGCNLVACGYRTEHTVIVYIRWNRIMPMTFAYQSAFGYSDGVLRIFQLEFIHGVIMGARPNVSRCHWEIMYLAAFTAKQS